MYETTQLSHQLLTAIVQLSLHASVVLFVVLAIQIAFRKKFSARWRYALWSIVVARLLIPWNYDIPIVTETVFAPNTTTIAVATPLLAVTSPPSTPSTPVQENNISSADEPTSQPDPVPTQPDNDAQTIATAIPAVKSIHEPRATGFILDLETVSFGIWIIGVLCIPLTIFVRHIRTVRRSLSNAVNPPSWVLDTLDQSRKEMGISVCPTIHITPEVHAPTLLGAIRPKILLPENLPGESSPDDVRLFLMHELAHLKSGDIWLSWIWCFALSLHWFNPLMWWAGTRIRRERELACDERVLKHIGNDAKDDYAQALLNAMEHVNENSTQHYRFGLAGIA